MSDIQNNKNENKIFNLIIGLTGPYGSGCSSLAEEFKDIIDGFQGCIVKTIHVADLIKHYSTDLNSDYANKADRRKALQKAGTELRKEDSKRIGKLISATIYGNVLELVEI